MNTADTANKAKYLITALALSLSASVYAAEVKVGFAPEPYPPFAVPDAAGDWTGWEIDIINAVCAEAQLDCKLTPTAWDALIPALNSSKIDLIMGAMSITEERAQVIDFSDKYYSTPGTVVSLKGTDVAPTAEGMKGKIIGVVGGTTHHNYVKTHFGDVVAEIKEYQTQDETNLDLAAGRIDATQADSLAMDEFLASDTGKACCQTNGTVPDDPAILGAGIGAGMRKGDTELKDKINAAIKGIRANGNYDEITKKYFNFNIYGD